MSKVAQRIPTGCGECHTAHRNMPFVRLGDSGAWYGGTRPFIMRVWTFDSYAGHPLVFTEELIQLVIKDKDQALRPYIDRYIHTQMAAYDDRIRALKPGIDPMIYADKPCDLYPHIVREAKAALGVKDE